jgi:hypothetical protein
MILGLRDESVTRMKWPETVAAYHSDLLPHTQNMSSQCFIIAPPGAFVQMAAAQVY